MHEYFKTLKNKSLPIFRQNIFHKRKYFFVYSKGTLLESMITKKIINFFI